MKEQIKLFLKYFLSIEDGSNEKIKNSKIDSLVFSPQFLNAFIKAQYINKEEIK